MPHASVNCKEIHSHIEQWCGNINDIHDNVKWGSLDMGGGDKTSPAWGWKWLMGYRNYHLAPVML